ncbi:hypothetical protein FJT64_019741 [Amphibalanus amphitrite]|uniref:ATP-dependent DNA helicase n=1 Tax=Amphibalanus amphitrite TaxID=1232801 RepID=A0A6A4WUY5_AMPAM|nr:hypothetical protein FJT64_019741 [Amphibalanus amphitrite]
MDTVCGHCGALRWQNEPKGACCHQGKVKLDFHPPPPDELVELMTPGTPYYDEFRGKIRAYNTAFQMASMGCDVVRHAGAPHAAFTVQGNVCHRIGTLLPVRDGEERFLQLYFLDAEQATERRATLCGGLDRVVLNILSGMLHVHNNYVRALQPALLMARGVPNSRIVLSADHRPRSEHERRFNLPMGREVAVLMPDEIRGPRDIVVHERGGQLFRINEFSRQYDPLCYVLLHPHGTDGWSIELKTARGVTMRQYAAFHIRYRPGHFNLIPRGGRLFQQYLVDTQVKVESDRLAYVREHQDGFNGFRAETIRGVRDALADGEEPDGVIDEVAQYQQSRFLGSMEAAWRLQDRPIHGHHPPVQQLQLHMDNDERRVVFRDDANLDAVLDGEQINHSMLTSFFELCQVDEFAATLLYTEVPRYYTWQVRRGRGADARPAHWRRRLRGQPHPDVPGVFVSDTLSRMYTTTPRAGEVFFLRLLLNNVRGPRSYEHLRTVNGRVCATMREACSELGLLEDGLHWARALDEASVTRFPGGLRFLFALILIEGEETCNPAELWMRFRDVLSEDIARRRDVARAAGRRALTDDEVYDEALRKLAVILRRLRGKTLAEYGLPVPPVLDVPAEPDDEPDGGAQFDPVVLAERVEREEVGLTDDQRAVYDEVLRRLDNGESGVIFLQAPGGCGKTYLENLLLAKVRSRGEVAVAVAASGIAASLLEGGTTAHYRFKIPVPEQVVSPAGSLPELVDRIFPNMDENYVDQEWLHERTILAPLNAIVDSANTAALALLPGETMTYYSVDTLTENDNEAEVGPIVPPEVLNAIDVSGMPSHRRQVKVGAPVVLMRNLNAPRVVNGTLCTVLRAAPNVLELRIASGIARGG